MYILQLHSGQNLSSGDYVYRVERPARALSETTALEVVNMDLLEPGDKSLLVAAPLLILHHLSDPDLLPVVRERQWLGLHTIYELADHFQASQVHRLENVAEPDYHVVMEALLKRCDAVQTTGGALEQRYGHLNPNFYIFPNLVTEVTCRPSDRDASSITVGWGGSARHFGDLDHYARAIKNWITSHPDSRLAIMGSQKIRRLFSDLPAHQIRLHQPGSLQEYITFLDGLDIGIAPLLSTEFNACRSDVKYLEYASREVVPLCSRFGPYVQLGREGENILFFEDPQQLVRHLEHLRSDPVFRKRMARQAREWVEKHRLQNTAHLKKRVQVYTKLCSHVSSGREQTFKKCLRSTRSEVANWLNHAIRAVQHGNSLVALKRALELFPEHYQTHYFYGWALCKHERYAAAAVALREALRRRPDSVRSAQLLARVLTLSGNFRSALVYTEMALEIEPHLSTLLKLKTTLSQLIRHSRAA